tara:strand:+ start:553 stop:816 length:264 start_codon:yes stop_codon:yes gene_type:complete
MKYDQKQKAPKSEVEDALHEICIEDIGEEYRILWQSDDGGNHVVVAFEGICPPKSKELIKSPFMGWRLIKLICPIGYLEVFHPLNKK